MMTDKEIFDAIRERRGKPLAQPDVDAINAILYPAGGSVEPLAWGGSVTPEFRDKVRSISARLGCNPSDLMTCMAWESGRSFSPAKKNMAGSGATGLIQFMPSTAQGLGTSVDALAAMTAVEQRLGGEIFPALQGETARSFGFVYGDPVARCRR